MCASANLNCINAMFAANWLRNLRFKNLSRSTRSLPIGIPIFAPFHIRNGFFFSKVFNEFDEFHKFEESKGFYVFGEYYKFERPIL